MSADPINGPYQRLATYRIDPYHHESFELPRNDWCWFSCCIGQSCQQSAINTSPTRTRTDQHGRDTDSSGRTRINTSSARTIPAVHDNDKD
ncbi:hypothetical protein DPMN_166355 [Dreissena polymorpha]|uniref:Uncharacterized protein n=1 Tax=Dreissena polymorpha TaxID=45954 RepID=A0A9D4F227_DREPO|nr:hypothetical protein DPMN_166355 [Dreissena polymorpha]